MSRLYYDKKTTDAGLVNGTGGSTKEYLEKVAKLIPTEIIAGYMAMIGLVPAIRVVPETQHPWFYIGIFLICLPLTAWYMYVQADKNKPWTIHIIVSTFAFVVWAYTISGNLVWPQIHDPAIASIILVLFSLGTGKIPLS